jgi:transposase
MADTMPYIPPESNPAKPKRRSFSAEQKNVIVEKALAPGASVSRVARVHDLNTNQVFKWMREHEAKPLAACATPALIPVVLHHGNTAAKPCPQEPVIAAAGTIELHLSKGRVCLTGIVDLGTLRMVLEHLTA